MQKTILLTLTVFAGLSLSAEAVLLITFDFDPTNDLTEIGTDNSANSILSLSNQALFNAAGSFWENNITGYADGISRSLTIHASGFSQAASAGGVTLGSAGPTLGNTFIHGGDIFVFTTAGQAEFNIHNDATGGTGLLNGATLRHEIGHILGVGTLWNTTGFVAGSQNNYTTGTGQYTGANALAAYRNEFDPTATFVPVELDGGPGTANGHWNEVTDNFKDESSVGFDSDPGDGAAALTVLHGLNSGLSIDDALMTGVLSGSTFLSDTTLGSLQDIGYTTIDFNAEPVAFTAVPEPSSLLFSLMGLSAFLLRRKRKSSS